MDYTILLISDAYLKSANCMYEVLEVMRDRNYRNKIFPAIIYPEVYKPVIRAGYVKYWQSEFEELKKSLDGINVQNLGNLSQNLKQRQNISSNIAEFLDVVSDMNNPNVEDICVCIEEILRKKGFLEDSQCKEENDLFSVLGIPKKKYYTQPTDLEINQFIKKSFDQIVKLLSQLCQQYQNLNTHIQIQIEQIDTRTVLYQFYENGKLVRGLKLFLSNMFGAARESIGLSYETSSFNVNSWNGMYDAIFTDGELKLHSTMSLMNSTEAMGIEEVVADIWENYIRVYLER